MSVGAFSTPRSPVMMLLVKLGTWSSPQRVCLITFRLLILSTIYSLNSTYMLVVDVEKWAGWVRISPTGSFFLQVKSAWVDPKYLYWWFNYSNTTILCVKITLGDSQPVWLIWPVSFSAIYVYFTNLNL